MQGNKDAVTGFDKRAHTIFCYKEQKTAPEFSPAYNENKEKCIKEDITRKTSWYTNSVPVIYNYLTLAIIGLLLWGMLWSAYEDWGWDGQWFRLAVVAVAAWASGQALQTVTTLPPMLAALLTGILARNVGYLDMNQYTSVDAFFRKIYPGIILGKASLGWDLRFIRENWRRLATLGTLPWLAEVGVLAVCVHLYLGFPLIWGFLLGTVYASVSCAVVMPSVVRINKSASGGRNWAQLVCTAGGTDTALSVGGYGIVFSLMFYETNDTYRYTKAGLTLFAGVALGVIMGTVAGLFPHSRDFHVAELRIAMVVVGGLLANTLTSMAGWGGAGGVAVLVCNATAAHFWALDGWKLNDNPASTAYRVMWSALEPMVFAYSGTFFEINRSLSDVLVPGFGILAVCLLVRLLVTCLTCWDFTLREKLFICCTWIPKSIVEAVLCPMAIDTLAAIGDPHTSLETQCAENMMRLLIQAILITTPLGFLLTNHLGPILLKEREKDCEISETSSQKRKSINGSHNEERT